MHSRTAAVFCCVLLLLAFGGAARAEMLPGTREALAEFETGATTAKQCDSDYMTGSRREISRFQILPDVWRRFSPSGEYHDPETAWTVAKQVLQEREKMFRGATGRQWDGVDLYLMWNAPGLYQRAHWDRAKVSRIVLERAVRFANLLTERSRVADAAQLAGN